jgi:hypothetical protein
MTVYKGREGTARIGGTTVGEVISWNVTVTANMQDASRMGDAWTRDESVSGSWSGDIEVFWDPADAGQSAAFGGTTIIGNRVTLNLYPRGVTGFPAVNVTGTVTIEEMGLPQAFGELIKRTFKFKGYGAPTLTGM